MIVGTIGQSAIETTSLYTFFGFGRDKADSGELMISHESQRRAYPVFGFLTQQIAVMPLGNRYDMYTMK